MDKEDLTVLYGTNAVYIEELYRQYLQHPNSVDESWRKLFDDLGDSVSLINKNIEGASWAVSDKKVIGASIGEPKKKSTIDLKNIESTCRDSIGALMLIRAYKVRGHLLSDLDPLKIEGNIEHPDLDPKTYGFTEDDYDREIFVGGELGFDKITINDLLQKLRQIYCGKIGVEFMHLPDLEQRNWIAHQMENADGEPIKTIDEKISILDDILKFELFEQFLQVKFQGAKRFSAEGGESVFAALEKIIENAAKVGVKEVMIGMAHRGRLNVLTKVMGRPYALMLAEFMGEQALFSEDIDASGDVKYHQGASSDRSFDGNDIHLSLAANPSHLECVNPVVAGRVRAKQDKFNDTDRKLVVPVVIHGDAAFSGQGIVPETITLSGLSGYTTGGVVHIIVNNQIGFTTSPKYSRSSPYPSDIAKGAHAPIFHVNGDDPEAVAYVSRLALEFRQKFGTDVVVDVFCYRRYGHNEGDEPFFTQPIMYKAIKKHPTPLNVYANKLIDENIITQEDFDRKKDQFKEFLNEEHKKAQDYKPGEADWFGGSWKGFEKPKRGIKDNADTGVDKNILQKIGKEISTVPEGMNPHMKLMGILRNRAETVGSGEGLNWATAEALAFGSLLLEGYNVRLSGQDSIRGTFSHRHSAMVNQDTEDRYIPLNNLSDSKANYEVLDSNLSEFAVLGFEYGYTLAEPNSLVLWEAQFGDFANGAQVIIDQFISAGETKWLRFSGLVMLLPHGYEGQGPEHSSARLERYLQLCAEDNMQVVNCTTPANYFHVLRRQLHRKFRKPLVIMTPKSLLRHKKCVSNLSEMVKGTSFKRVIGETEKITSDSKVRKIVICSGKVYYDVLAAREEENKDDVAIIRLEQYYPYPDEDILQEIKKYPNVKEIVWCQEEPKNMGAWHFLDRRLEKTIIKAKLKVNTISYAGRPNAASPAAGYSKIHNKKQKALIAEALK